MKSIFHFLTVGAVAALAAGFGAGIAAADNSQTAANSAESAQVATAVSGDASALNGGTALSGSAAAAAYLSTVQSIMQHASNGNAQDASNSLLDGQQTASLSGIVSADAGDATSGAAAAIAEQVHQQIIEQFGQNDVPPADDNGEDGDNGDNGEDDEDGEEVEE